MRTRSPFAHPMTAQTGRPTLAQLKALPVMDHLTGEAFLLSDGSRWYYSPTSVLTGDDILVVTPDNYNGAAQAGRYLRAEGHALLKLPIAFGTADGATLLTLPTGCRFRLEYAYWDVTTAFTGGSSSAIGIDSSKTGYTTAGDILGGASGDVEATLTAGVKAGTIGAIMDTDAEKHSALFVAADTIRFQRITSAFTAGAGFAVLEVNIHANPGA